MIKHFMTILVVAAVAAMILTIGSCDKMKQIPGNVAGQLINEAGQGQGFISVQLVEVETGKVANSVVSDDNGSFMFKAVDPGKYIIKTMPIGGGELPNDCKEFTLAMGKTLTKSVVVTYEIQ